MTANNNIQNLNIHLLRCNKSRKRNDDICINIDNFIYNFIFILYFISM